DSLPRPRLELPADALRVAAVERIPVAANRTAVSICAGGDVAFGTNLSEGWRGSAAVRWGVSPDQLPTPHDLAGRIGELMPPADVVLLNVEGALGDEQVPPKCAPGSTACYAIRMP